MSSEPNKPIGAQELTEKELECVTGGGHGLMGGFFGMRFEVECPKIMFRPRPIR